jgi:citrate lyase subunit beta / citryl-CoA lyase
MTAAPFRPHRSALYMPATNLRALEKAKTLACDVVIMDLEDAVAPEMKAAARAQAVAAVQAGGYGRRELVIRVNAMDSPWFDADIAAAARSGADAVLLPKVSGPEIVNVTQAMLRAAGAGGMRIWAMIETARGVSDIAAITAPASRPDARLACLVIGANDLAKDTGARMLPDRAPMLSWLQTVLLAARANGLSILDSVYNDFAHLDGCRAEAAQGRDLGFDGKTLSHPSQIGPVNEVFSPTADEVARASAVIAAFALPENHGKGVIRLNGAMVERLHEEMARRVVALDAMIRAVD